jgi:hypothetical protein
MPDIKSELSKVLNQWDKHEETIRNPKEKTMTKDYGFKPTNNVSRETFQYVYDHAGQNGKQVIAAMKARGFNESSVGSLLTQMVRMKSIRRDQNGGYFPLAHEYQPIKSASKKKIEKPEQPSAGIAALPPTGGSKHIKEGYKFTEHAPRKNSLILNRDWTPYKAIENLNVFQARALYDELKKMFGE